jgi:hypothetical protein
VWPQGRMLTMCCQAAFRPGRKEVHDVQTGELSNLLHQVQRRFHRAPRPRAIPAVEGMDARPCGTCLHLACDSNRYYHVRIELGPTSCTSSLKWMASSTTESTMTKSSKQCWVVRLQSIPATSSTTSANCHATHKPHTLSSN